MKLVRLKRHRAAVALMHWHIAELESDLRLDHPAEDALDIRLILAEPV